MSTTIPSDTLWLVVTVVAAISVAFRLSFFLLFGRVDEVPAGVERALGYVAPAVLAALVLPELLYLDGGVSPLNPRSVAGVVAAAVAWRTDNIALTVAVGMIVFWGVRALG